MKRVAVIGAGISGLASAQVLKDRADVVVFERDIGPGGLIRCVTVNGSLFHLCGGHVFNTKDEAVSHWFWERFDRDRDFIRKDRRSAICLEDGRFIGYPIENHVYQLEGPVQRKVYAELAEMTNAPVPEPRDFGDFLLKRFGKTLCDIYFRPYNEKIWRCDLSQIPLSWLEGKLPMPRPDEILRANREKAEEREFVHSSFYYPRQGGSQFIADTLAYGLDIRFSTEVNRIELLVQDGWRIEGERFDAVVFTGNLKALPELLKGNSLGSFADGIAQLESHGTTAVFCETDPIPYSWFYQPTSRHSSHRFICTGNFSPNNNAAGKMTCTVEFTDAVSDVEIDRQLQMMPFHPRRLRSHYTQCSYPIQNAATRDLIGCVRSLLAKRSFYLVGRFAEWEYYNMDAAIRSALRISF